MTLLYIAFFNAEKVIERVELHNSEFFAKYCEEHPEIEGSWAEIGLPDVNTPGVNWYWNEEKETWSPPKPFSNWVLSDDNVWIPPLPKPTEEPKGNWYWHQEDNSWHDIVPQP
jgi:hypothetical protein